METRLGSLGRAFAALAALAMPSGAQTFGFFGEGWAGIGKGPERAGLAPLSFGPKQADLLWSANEPSIIAWQPFVWVDQDPFVPPPNRVAVCVRQTAFPSAAGPGDSLVAFDLESGAELWRVEVPFAGTASEWILWIGGIGPDGTLWVSRSDNGRAAVLHRYDVRTGHWIGSSAATTRAFAYDGIVFADNGDAIVGDNQQLVRIDAVNGATVWQISRTCSVSGNCGAARAGDALYIDQVAPGGQRITRLDLHTGAELYSSPAMVGLTAQSSPFAAPGGGRVYFSRTQNNAAVDRLFAFDDTGSALVEAWSTAVRWTTSESHGIGPDGSVYAVLPDDRLARLHPATGQPIATSAPLSPVGANLSPRLAVDGDGKVYLSNGWASSPALLGRLWAFDRNLSPLFELSLDRPNAGGPVLVASDTLLIADRVALRAYRSAVPTAALFPLVGGGLNPIRFLPEGPPVLGAPWVSTNTTEPTTALTLVGLALQQGSLPLWCSGPCEWLLDANSLILVDGALGQHSLPVPSIASLAGVELFAQGARVDVAFGVPSLELHNAFQLRLGL